MIARGWGRGVESSCLIDTEVWFYKVMKRVLEINE